MPLPFCDPGPVGNVIGLPLDGVVFDCIFGDDSSCLDDLFADGGGGVELGDWSRNSSSAFPES